MKRPLLILLAFYVGFPASGAHAGRRTEMLHIYKSAGDSDAGARGAASRTWLIVNGAEEDEVAALWHRLLAAGVYPVDVFYPEGVIVASMPRDGHLDHLLAVPGFVRMPEAGVGPATVSSEGRNLRWIRSAYESVDARGVGTGQSAGHTSTVAQFDDMVITATPAEMKEAERRINEARRMRAPSVHDPLAGSTVSRATNQNSEVLGGSVVAQFIYPQSDGSFEPTTDIWSDEDLIVAKRGSTNAMLDWRGQWPKMKISFWFEHVDKNAGGENNVGATTAYEPIQHNSNDDAGTWVLDTTRRTFPGIAGHLSDAFAAVHEVNNWRRARRGTNWAFTGFIARSRSQPENRFVGAGYTAYAYLGGPFLVQPFPSGGDPKSIGEEAVYRQIINHEAGHVFWTLDEYPGAPGVCSSTSGYLNYANANITLVSPGGGTVRCEEYDPCIMNIETREQDYQNNTPWCDYSEGHLGVIDDNGNGLPDILEAEPIIEWAVAGAETVTTNKVNVAFTARSGAVPNRNTAFPDDAINYVAPLGDGYLTLGGATARVDLVPLDGSWNEAEEDLQFNLELGSVGRIDLHVVVENAAGYKSQNQFKTIYFIGVSYSHINSEVYRDRVKMSWQVVGEDFGAEYNVYRLASGEAMPGLLVSADVQPSGPSRNGFTPYEMVDRTIEPGKTYQYYVDGSFTLTFGGATKAYNSLSTTVTTVAMLPPVNGSLLSQAAPNPFRDQVAVTLTVPATFGKAEFGDAQIRVPTTVRADVYDVAGRRVASLYEGSGFEDALQLRWDGRTDGGSVAPTGIYFVRAEVGSQLAVRKIVLIR